MRGGVCGFVLRHRYYRLSHYLGLEIPLGCSIGAGCIIWHTKGIVLNSKCIIGNNCAILHGVTIGNSVRNPEHAAVIDDGTSIGAGAKLIGPIHIGKNVNIGANAVVTHDLPDKCTAAGIPAKVIRIRDEVNILHDDYLTYEEFVMRR